jgi:hypothetical protein
MRSALVLGLSCAVLVFLAGTALSSNSQTGTYAAPFLKIGVNARAFGMGEAQVALVDDSSSIYWNPAGLAKISRGDITFTDNEWLSDIRYNFVAWGYHLKKLGTFGAGLSYLSYGDIPGYDPQGNPTGTFGARDIAVYLSYARSLYPSFRIGANFKYIVQKVEAESGGAVAMDLGLQYDTPLKGLSLGFSAANLGSKLKLVDQSAKLPINIRSGLAYSLSLASGKFTAITAFDLVKALDNEFQYNFGEEFSILGTIVGRVGYKANTDISGFCTGIGFKHSFGRIGLRLDYAYTAIKVGELGDTHQVSLGLGF